MIQKVRQVSDKMIGELFLIQKKLYHIYVSLNIPIINYSVEEKVATSMDDSAPNDVSYSISHSISDELIPFSDSPQISRYYFIQL